MNKGQHNDNMGAKEAISEFNKHHGAEAKAELMKCSEGLIVVKMSGHYCNTCGVEEYHEDLRMTLEDYGMKTQIIQVEASEEGSIVTLHKL